MTDELETFSKFAVEVLELMNKVAKDEEYMSSIWVKAASSCICDMLTDARERIVAERNGN